MAKDDYYVLAAKVLVYLYKRLKKKTTEDLTYLSPYTKQFPVDEEYFNYVLEQLLKQGMIEGVNVHPVMSAPPLIYITPAIRITPAGIDFLQDNSKIRKILEMLPEAAGLVASFLPLP